jgi:hypothetical protein
MVYQMEVLINILKYKNIIDDVEKAKDYFLEMSFKQLGLEKVISDFKESEQEGLKLISLWKPGIVNFLSFIKTFLKFRI